MWWQARKNSDIKHVCILAHANLYNYWFKHYESWFLMKDRKDFYVKKQPFEMTI